MTCPATGPTSVRFTEEMRGHVSFGVDDYARGARDGRASGTRLGVRLTVAVADLGRFGTDGRREAEARGSVWCDALGGRLAVERGTANLLVADGARKRMEYRLLFRDGVGHPLTLTGVKVVGAGSPVHVWRDTTTLFTRVVRGHVGPADDPGAEVVASGVLRIGPLGFLRQLTTFRAGAPSLAGRLAAVGRYDARFLRDLWEAYRPAPGGPPEVR